MADFQEAVFSGSLLLAIPVAMAAGLVSFFSPCALPLVPGYLSYVAGTAGPESDQSNGSGGLLTRTRPRMVLGTLLFVSGFGLVFTSYGALFGAFGSRLVVHQETLIKVSGAVTIILGLLFAGLAEKLPIVSRTIKPKFRPRVGLLGAPLLGITFGIGWTPCIGPVLAAVLTLATNSATAERGALLSFAYSLGLGIPFLIAALSLTKAMRVFGWARRNGQWISRIGGASLVIIGVLQVSGVWSRLVYELQFLVAGWTTPI